MGRALIGGIVECFAARNATGGAHYGRGELQPRGRETPSADFGIYRPRPDTPCRFETARVIVVAVKPQVPGLSGPRSNPDAARLEPLVISSFAAGGIRV